MASLEGLSPAELQNVPAVPPPPGQLSNFHDPESRSSVVVAVSSVCFGLMWIIFSGRMYARCWILRMFWFDDAACVTAVALITAYFSGLVWEMGILGPHGYDIRLIDLTGQFSKISLVLTAILYAPAIFFAKLAIFSLYIKTFGINRWIRWLSYAGILANFILYFVTVTIFSYYCVPKDGKSWFMSSSAPPCKAQAGMQDYVQGSWGVFSDIYIFLLPIPLVWNLQMPLRKRAGVLAIFASGLLAIVASILGLYYRLDGRIDSGGSDPFWNLPLPTLLAVIELTLGVMCSSMPYIPAIFRKHRFLLSGSLSKSFKNLLQRLSRRRTRASRNEQWHDLENTSSEQEEKDQPRVRTSVLGSIHGNGTLFGSRSHDGLI